MKKTDVAAIERKYGASFSEICLKLHDLEGMTCQEIAREIGVSYETFRALRLAHGVKIERHKPIELRGADNPNSLEYKARKLGYSSLAHLNADLHAAGLMVCEREKLLGCGRDGIRQVLATQGIPPLPQVVNDALRAKWKRCCAAMREAKAKRRAKNGRS